MDPVAVLKTVFDAGLRLEDRAAAADAYNRWTRRGGFPAAIDGRPVRSVTITRTPAADGKDLISVETNAEHGVALTWFDDDECAARRVIGTFA